MILSQGFISMDIQSCMQDSNQLFDQDFPTNYCFCTLAFGSVYRLASQKLAAQLEKQGFKLIIVTDVLQDCESSNVTLVKGHRTSIFYAYNDKRFALAEALRHHDCAVFIDADSTINGILPKQIRAQPGLTGFTTQRSLEEILIRHHSQNIETFKKLARKCNLDLKNVQWVRENLFIIRRDKEETVKKFLDFWGFSDRWLGLRRVFQGDAAFIGLSCSFVGWKVHQSDDLLQLEQLITNIGVGRPKNVPKGYWASRRLGFYWRFIQALLESLKDLKGYYL
jgi:hypothetical protein